MEVKKPVVIEKPVEFVYPGEAVKQPDPKPLPKSKLPPIVRPEKVEPVMKKVESPVKLPPQEEKSLSKNVSRDKIKVFNEDDDSDIEAHLEESRKKFVDPMEQGNSDSSNPPTPIKQPTKVAQHTDGSVALSEQAVKDAKSYVQNLYSKNKATNMRKDPFDYGSDRDQISEKEVDDDGRSML